MMSPPSPPSALHDPARLAALAAFGETEAYRGSNVDRIVRLLALHFGVPYSNALFVRPDRLSHFARYSGGEAETSLEQFPTGTDLSVAIVEHGAALLVEDLGAHPVFSQNPFVAHEGGIRFFAGVPLRAEGQVIGVLCVLDRLPHAFRPTDAAFLDDTAALVMDELMLLRQAQQLREAENRTREVLNATNSGFLAIDDDGCITHMNWAAERILHRQRADCEGHPLHAVFPAASLARFNKVYDRVREENTATSFVARYPALDAWLEVRVAPFERGLTLYFDDVSTPHRIEAEREQHRKAVARSEQAFRTLAEHLPSMVVRYDRDLRVLYANPSAERFTGSAPPALLGRHAGAPGTAAEPVPRWAQTLQEVLQTGEMRRMDVSYVLPDGMPRYGQAVMVPEGEPDGNVASVLTTIHEVTDFVVARQRLEASEQKYRSLSILIKAFAYAYAVPEDGSPPRIEWMTGSVEDVTGWPAEAFEGLAWGAMIDPRDRAVTEDRMRAAFRGETRTDDVRMVGVDGRTRWIRLHMQPELDPETGRVVRIHGAGTDVGVHKEAEFALIQAKEQAEEMARLKDAFLANMSHEIRTPLTSVLGFTELLRDEVGEAHREYVDMIQASGRRLQETLTSVLELSQLQSGQVVLHPEVVNVAALAEETIRLLTPQARARGLDLHLDAPEPGLRARCNAAALGRVLTNLIGNAIKFTNTGTVTARLRTEGADLELQVIDTGVGMAPGFLPHLFEDFRQESRGLGRTHEGNGLGLSISRRLVELMGGTIAVASEKGHGTTFTVRLPRAGTPTRRAAPLDEQPGVRPAAAPTSVLVVEDDNGTRALLGVLLRPHYHVTFATTAPEALAVARAAEAPFEGVLLDIHLGDGVSGEALLPELRALPALHGARFVAMTAYALPGDRERFLAAGFEAYVAKPFTRRDLLQVLRPGVEA